MQLEHLFTDTAVSERWRLAPLSALRGRCLDEVGRDHGACKDTLKPFCSGGKVPFRRNHEQEVKYTSWECCAKCWPMYTADFPIIPFAIEASHSRRFRATFMRANLKHDIEAVNVEENSPRRWSLSFTIGFFRSCSKQKAHSLGETTWTTHPSGKSSSLWGQHKSPVNTVTCHNKFLLFHAGNIRHGEKGGLFPCDWFARKPSGFDCRKALRPDENKFDMCTACKTALVSKHFCEECPQLHDMCCLSHFFCWVLTMAIKTFQLNRMFPRPRNILCLIGSRDVCWWSSPDKHVTSPQGFRTFAIQQNNPVSYLMGFSCTDLRDHCKPSFSFLQGKMNDRQEEAAEFHISPATKSRKVANEIAGQGRLIKLIQIRNHVAEDRCVPVFGAFLGCIPCDVTKAEAKQDKILHLAHAYFKNNETPQALKAVCRVLLKRWRMSRDHSGWSGWFNYASSTWYAFSFALHFCFNMLGRSTDNQQMGTNQHSFFSLRTGRSTIIPHPVSGLACIVHCPCFLLRRICSGCSQGWEGHYFPRLRGWLPHCGQEHGCRCTTATQAPGKCWAPGEFYVILKDYDIAAELAAIL